MRKLFLIPLLFIFSVASFGEKRSPAELNDSPPVIELKALLKADTVARENLQQAFKHLQDLPDGSRNPWQGKSEGDLYSFLNEWFYFLPTAHDGLDRIMQFSLLYYKNPYGLAFINGEAGRKWALSFVTHRGKFMDSPASLVGVEQWLNNPAVNNDDFLVPEGGYQSFNHYFVRELKHGKRPVDGVNDDAMVVSPADCIVNKIENDIQTDSSLPLKSSMTLNISNMLGGSKLAEKFVGGTAYACFLMPDNYHHYHSPVAGRVVEADESVGSKLFGSADLISMVNKGDPGRNQDFSVFEEFKHGYLIIETESMGHVAMIPVGLQTVGSVIFEDKFRELAPEDSIAIAKGERVGHFAYGGSTVLMIFEKGKFNALSVKQGQQIGVANH